MKRKVAFCPNSNWSCPHMKPSGICSFEDPWINCDDFKDRWDEDEEYYSLIDDENI